MREVIINIVLANESASEIGGPYVQKMYEVDPYTREKLWRSKIDNSMVNTVNFGNTNELVASTMDGKIAFLDLQY